MNVNEIIERELPGLPGWCTNEKGRRLAELVRGASLVVELGVFGGRSLVAMALALKGMEFIGFPGRIDGIDPYTPAAALEGVNDPANDEWWSKLDYDAVEHVAQEALYRLDLMPYARLVRMRSLEVVDYYADGTVDLLHQDSNHSEAVSREEVVRWTPKIRPGGYWVFDDTNWPTTKQAQLDLRALGFEEIEDYDSWKVYRKCS